MDDVALKISGLYKDFRLPHQRQDSIKERVLHFRRHNTFEELHALRDINFEVEKGEFFGIVGRNGSGKSTLLKIIGGIYQPTKGVVSVNGTLTPFIELGIGFNPELTGRENVFLNGAILGLTTREVKSIYDEIVAFAELEKFMDQKLKNYSSGMQVRLAFSIAIRAHNDILLIDEVLAVGDANFQRKCFNVFKEIKKSGKTVIFVTHDMGAVQEFCDRAMMIQDSRVLMVGKPREVALRYEIANSAVSQVAKTSNDRPANPAIKLDKIKLRGNAGRESHFSLKDEIAADVDFSVNEPTDVQFNAYLVRPDGHYVAGLNTTGDLKRYKPPKGKHRITCKFRPGQLAPGDYRLNVGVYTYDEPAQLIDVLDNSYGVNTPQLNLYEVSPRQNGDFNIDGSWTDKEG